MNNPFEIIDARISNIENLILDLKHKSGVKLNNAPDLDQPLTVQQAAKFLNLAVPTVYALVSQQVLPHSKKGKRLYFSKSELTDWVQSGRKKTIAEIEAEATAFNFSKKKRG